MNITDTDGRPVSLSAFRGKPTVLVYEDRHSTTLNQPFKDAMHARKELQAKANLVAVAYLKPFDFFPARGFALKAVRDMEEKLGIPLYVDFTGDIATQLGLVTTTANVVLLDPKGDVIRKFSGRLSEAQGGEILKLIDERF